MTNEERDDLLNEIEQIRTSIERLEPEIHDQEARFASAVENSRATLIALRKDLARDMERLHEDRTE